MNIPKFASEIRAETFKLRRLEMVRNLKKKTFSALESNNFQSLNARLWDLLFQATPKLSLQ